MENIDNIKLLEFSLKNPEPVIDEFYLKNGNLIISKNPKEPTDLMKNNLDLLESISAYSFAKKNNNEETTKKAIEKISEIIKSKNINYSEFVSFWPVVDISYSLFDKMTEDYKKYVLQNIVDKYIDLRHGIYSTYGYTPTTLQVGKDAKAHKESGNLGINKVSKILNESGFTEANSNTAKDFLSKGDKKYVHADKSGKKLFKELLKYIGINFSWSAGKEGKMPDFLIKIGDDIFIMEHKHMKEGGGGQDKQVSEVISFIGFSEKNKKIHYVSCLDGIYFNLFSNEKYLHKGKILNQINSIKENLTKNKQNYFVNTAGFKKLIKT